MLFYVEQISDGKKVFEDVISFVSKDDLQGAQNKAIINWIGKQGNKARIQTRPDNSLSLKVSTSPDREIWTRID